MPEAFNIDEAPINRDQFHRKWRMPPYKSDAFFLIMRDDLGMTLADFKQTAMFVQAVADGKIVNDKWVPAKDR